MSERYESFCKHMIMLRAQYPSHRQGDREWSQTMVSFWERLKQYPNPVLAAVFGRAPTCHRDWFPSAGQLESIAKSEAKTHRGVLASAQQKALPPRRAATKAPRLPPDNPFERLARKLEQHPPRNPEEGTLVLRTISKMLAEKMA